MGTKSRFGILPVSVADIWGYFRVSSRQPRYFHKFQIPQKLYGRQREVETLLAAFERVAATNNRPYRTEQTQISVLKKRANPEKKVPGSVFARGQHKSRSEMMLIAGYSGIGKSAM